MQPLPTSILRGALSTLGEGSWLWSNWRPGPQVGTWTVPVFVLPGSFPLLPGHIEWKAAVD